VPSNGVVTVYNYYDRVATRVGGELKIKLPKAVNMVELVARSQILAELRSLDAGKADINLADMHYAILDHDCWVDLQLWTKRFLADIGYVYVGDRRDCNAFARAMRMAFDLLGEVAFAGSPTVGGIYAHMDEPFAGITDGFHALNLSRTNKGGFVSEPQGINLIYQRAEIWAMTRRITSISSD